MSEIYRVPIKNFRKANAQPERGKKVIYKTRLGKTINTRVVKVNRSDVILKKINEKE